MRVLVIEDNQSTAKALQHLLKSADYVVDITASGEDGLEIARHYEPYDIIILDLILQDIEGYEILRRLKALRIQTPVLILSGLNNISDKLKGFGFGADDYMTKPFDNKEFLARVKAIIRRAKGHSDSVIKIGDLEVNTETKTVLANNKPLELTKREYAILELMSIRRGATLSKEIFLNHLYGGMEEPEFKIIDVFVCKLRKKLDEALNNQCYIHTVWGRGYVLRQPSEDAQDEEQASHVFEPKLVVSNRVRGG